MNLRRVLGLALVIASTAFPASADQTKRVCMGGNGCPWTADGWYPCGNSIDDIAAEVCAVTRDGVKSVRAYSSIHISTKGGGQCGFNLHDLTCHDE